MQLVELRPQSCIKRTHPQTSFGNMDVILMQAGYHVIFLQPLSLHPTRHTLRDVTQPESSIYLLSQAGYHVIFLHRARSIQPFADSSDAHAGSAAHLGGIAL